MLIYLPTSNGHHKTRLFRHLVAVSAMVLHLGVVNRRRLPTRGDGRMLELAAAMPPQVYLSLLALFGKVSWIQLILRALATTAAR